MDRVTRTLFVLILISVSIRGTAGDLWAQPARSLRFEVAAPPDVESGSLTGHLIIVTAPVAGRQTSEPRHRIGSVGAEAIQIAAVDVDRIESGQIVIVDETSVAFPFERLSDLSPAEYDVQAVLDVSRDIRMPGAPGNWYSQPQRISVEPNRDLVVSLALTDRVPPERAPSGTEYVRYVQLSSERLSSYHGRPVVLRAAVILPRGFDREPSRQYPIRLTVGGYGRRYTAATRLMRDGSPFRRAWLADDAPRMLQVLLDGVGPYGDPYQVNSPNNGPYGDALVLELIPYIESRFRGLGVPRARVIDGISTGGWVALALHIFYPDSFNGAWSYCPDPVDFRALQRINIYDDDDAYVEEGGERPSRRGPDGTIRFTMRHELRMENVLGRGDNWTQSGRQWGAWNAAYGPRGTDGRPVPLWDPTTGLIDRDVTPYWESYDLRLVLARSWATLAPKLDGKLNIWVGEMDDYYLNDAVHLFDTFLRNRDPRFDARIVYGPGEGHCWVPHSPEELLKEMGARVGAEP